MEMQWKPNKTSGWLVVDHRNIFNMAFLKSHNVETNVSFILLAMMRYSLCISMPKKQAATVLHLKSRL